MQFATMASYTDGIGAKVFVAKDITAGIARWRADAISSYIAGQPVVTMSLRPASTKSPINRYRLSGRFPTVDSNGVLLRSSQFDLDIRCPEGSTVIERQQLLYMIYNAVNYSAGPGLAIANAEGLF